MKKIRDTVNALCSRRGNEYCDVLVIVLEVAQKYYPKRPLMRDICAEAGALCNKKEGAINRALGRANDDIWDSSYDMLCAMLGRPLYEKPSPKDLIYMLRDEVIEDGDVMASL